jgi:4-alpha-glucanotransferase
MTVSPEEHVIDELARLLHIEPRYHDIWGNLRVISRKSKESILKAMGVKDAAEKLAELKRRPWNRLLEPVEVISADAQPHTFRLHFPLEDGQEEGVTVTLSFQGEEGATSRRVIRGVVPAEAARIDGKRHVRVDIPDEAVRPMGYHRLAARVRRGQEEMSGSMRFIVAPNTSHPPPERTWGLWASLYSLRSERNWGFGDFGDLAALAEWVGAEGGAFVGINPLHATPDRVSFVGPYGPSSRLYMNQLYLDLEEVLSGSAEGRAFLEAPETRRKIEELRAKELIDYDGVWELKERALRTAFGAFLENHIKKGTPEGAEFSAYIEREGEPLHLFALFRALDAEFGSQGEGRLSWRAWPEGFRSPRTAEVQRFAATHPEEILLHKFVQWLLAERLARVRARIAEGGGILYGDLAVGSSEHGSDAWSFSDVFAFGIHTGAPPDDFNPRGQNWVFPPLCPEALRESGYEVFIQTVRKNLARVDAIRIDHALSLFRLFWIPEGASPPEGAYVRYPHEDLLRIVCLESVRSRTVVVAEDLGTVPAGVRETLRRFGMLGYRLFYFERDWESGEFLPPGAYPDMALTAVTTHDLPTLRGFWSGHDIEVKRALGVYADEEAYGRALTERQRQKTLVLEALKKHLSPELRLDSLSLPAMTEELFLEIHRYLARTPSKMMAVSLDDLMFAADQQNMPGTRDPSNWRHKSPELISTLPANERARALARIMREEGRA